jgi:ketosteroid isomerase-like protein
MPQNKNEIEMRNVIVQVFLNWSSMNPDANDPYFKADDKTVLFDSAPMQDIGWSTQKNRLKQVFKNFQYFKMEPNEDLAVHCIGDLGWATTTWKYEIHLKNGKQFNQEGRGTFVLQKQGDNWLVVHDHISVPEID